MLEYIAERVRKRIAELSFVQIAGGLAEPVVRDDSGNARRFPVVRPWPGAEVEPGDMLNMAPNEGTGCLAFVDATDDVRTVRDLVRWIDVEGLFRVVVWYDERQVIHGDGSDTARALANEIVKAVHKADFSGEGVTGRARFMSSTNDPGVVWSRYGMGVDDRALFMHPYRTFAVTFKFQGRYSPSCFCPHIINAAVC